jgi:hypothetical protein
MNCLQFTPGAAHRERIAFGQLQTGEENVRSWFRMRQGKSNFSLVRCEELLADPATELKKACPCGGIQATPARIEPALNLSSVKHLRSLQRGNGHARQDIPFVREARSGGGSAFSDVSVKNI